MNKMLEDINRKAVEQSLRLECLRLSTALFNREPTNDAQMIIDKANELLYYVLHGRENPKPNGKDRVAVQHPGRPSKEEKQKLSDVN